MIAAILVTLVLCLVSVVNSSGLYGWDTHMITKSSTIDCLKQNNDAQFIILTAMDSNAVVDPDVCNELKWAQDSNIPHRDVKFIPCPTCASSAETQFSMMMDNLKTNCSASSWSGRVWMDVNSNNLWFTTTRQDTSGEHHRSVTLSKCLIVYQMFRIRKEPEVVRTDDRRLRQHGGDHLRLVLGLR